MFGLLKKKLSTFSDKLKQTVSAKPESEEVREESENLIEKEEPKAKEEKKVQEKMLEKKEVVQEKKEIKIEEKKAKVEVKKEEQPKKRTKEEIAEEMERKLFEEIEKEMGEEVKETPTGKGVTTTTTIEEKTIEAKKEEKIVEEAEREIAKEEEKKAQEGAARELAAEARKTEKMEDKKVTSESEKVPTEEKKEKKKGLLGFVFGRKKEEKVEKQKEEVKEKETREEEIKVKPIEREGERKKPLEVIAEELRAEEKKTEKIKDEPLKKELEEEAEDIEKELAIEESKETALLQEEEKEGKEAAIEEQNQRMEEKRKQLEDFEIKGAQEDKRELKASVGAGGKLKGMLFGGVEISEKDISELLDELELSLIESDVEQDAAIEIVKQIKASLIGKKVSAKSLDNYLNGEIKRILTEMMTTEQINVLEAAKTKKEKPYRILMLGPNGAGKTTSIAKLTNYFQKNKMSVILAAGDTFRAAAIDQLEEHAKRLGVRVVKQQYGADPAAVAFDTIRAAQAGKIDVVIIDSAGRQETNKNLMEELKKLERVAKPDLKIYVGEAYAGQGLLEQATEFNDMVGLDGFILTKIDTDAKGGTTISLLYKLKKPILFVGTGQGYDDLKEFTPEFILNRII